MTASPTPKTIHGASTIRSIPVIRVAPHGPVPSLSVCTPWSCRCRYRQRCEAGALAHEGGQLAQLGLACALGARGGTRAGHDVLSVPSALNALDLGSEVQRMHFRALNALLRIA
jgi:hypothetical protein